MIPMKRGWPVWVQTRPAVESPELSEVRQRWREVDEPGDRAVHCHRRQLLRTLGLLAAPTLLPLAVRAHGDRHADGPRDVVREQKPWGIGAAPAEATRTITIRMDDKMRFTPAHLDVREGETLRLRIANRGKLLHEMVIGTPEELQAHAELMKKHPGMEHDEPYMAHVNAGRRGEITWTFNRPGEFEFACLIAGHFEAGMRGTIRVRPKS